MTNWTMKSRYHQLHPPGSFCMLSTAISLDQAPVLRQFSREMIHARDPTRQHRERSDLPDCKRDALPHERASSPLSHCGSGFTHLKRSSYFSPRPHEVGERVGQGGGCTQFGASRCASRSPFTLPSPPAKAGGEGKV